jgi:hypothetical protein
MFWALVRSFQVPSATLISSSDVCIWCTLACCQPTRCEHEFHPRYDFSGYNFFPLKGWSQVWFLDCLIVFGAGIFYQNSYYICVFESRKSVTTFPLPV